MNKQLISQLPSDLKQNYVSSKKEYDEIVFIAEQTREISRPKKKLTREQEIVRSRYLFRDAHRIMHNVMLQIRQGDQIDISLLQSLTNRILVRLNENPDTFLSICRDKQRAEYTFMRSVSFSALMLMFARKQGFSLQDQHHIGIGALLHDAGKMWLPLQLLNKPGKLNRQEEKHMHEHIKYSKMILFSMKEKPSPLSLAVACEHHERLDGSGYPNKLKEADISLLGQMAGIIDVFDATTSNRTYGDPITPTGALQHLLLQPNKYNEELVQQFIRSIGIYPTGTLVELEDDLLGIVTEQNHDLRFPKVLLFFDRKQRRRIPHTIVDLSRERGYSIKGTLTEKECGFVSRQAMS